MSIWQRWLVLGVVSAGLWGCGGDDSKKDNAAPAAAGAAGPPQAAVAGAGRQHGPPPSAAPVQAASSDFSELLQFLPENLKLAAGANFAALGEKTNVVGPRLLTQFQPATMALSRAGIKVDQIERLWSGSNRETGDLLICVRTKANYDAAAATKGLGAGASEKIGKATVHNLPADGAYKNAIAYIDPKTLLLGRYATITAALGNPKPGPVRFGYDAIDQPDAYYWIAGDESISRMWMGEGGGNTLGAMFGESLRMRGMGVGFGGAPRAGAPATPTRRMTRADEDEEEQQAGRMRGVPPGTPALPNIDMAMGMSFVSEALATSIETKFNQMMKAFGQPANAAAFPRRDRDRDEYRAPGPGATPAANPAVASPMAGMGTQITRTKENLRFGISLPAEGVPFVARFINEAMTATGSSALSDGIFEGSLTKLAAALRDWPAARPETLKGVRRINDLRVTAGYGWMTELLPYVDRADLYALFDFNKSWSEPENLPHTMTVIPAFLNPADPRATWEGLPLQYHGMALTHFVGMSGIEDDRNFAAAELPRSDPRAGIFGYDEVARPADVTDGASQTIMMIGSGEVAAPWVQGGGATIRGARAPYFQKYSGFGSRGTAPPGAFVLFADGSARSISAEIDPTVFKALCTMHGAEKVDMSMLTPAGQE